MSSTRVVLLAFFLGLLGALAAVDFLGLRSSIVRHTRRHRNVTSKALSDLLSKKGDVSGSSTGDSTKLADATTTTAATATRLATRAPRKQEDPNDTLPPFVAVDSPTTQATSAPTLPPSSVAPTLPPPTTAEETMIQTATSAPTTDAPPPPSPPPPAPAPKKLLMPMSKLRTAAQCQPYTMDMDAVNLLRQSHPVCNKFFVNDLVAVRFGDKKFLESFAPPVPTLPASGDTQDATYTAALAEFEAAKQCRKKEANKVKQLLAHLDRSPAMECPKACWTQLRRKVKQLFASDPRRRKFRQRLQQQDSSVAPIGASAPPLTNASDDSADPDDIIINVSDSPSSPAPSLSSSTGDSNSTSPPPPPPQPRSPAFSSSEAMLLKPLRIVVTFILGGPEPPFILNRALLIRTFLENHNAATDEIHIITDHWIDGQRFMAVSIRRIMFRRRIKAMRQSGLEANLARCARDNPTNKENLAACINATNAAFEQIKDQYDYNQMGRYVPKVRVLDASSWKSRMQDRDNGLPSRPQTATNMRVWYMSYYVDVALPQLLAELERRADYVITCDARDVYFQSNMFDGLDQSNFSRNADDEWLFAVQEEQLFFRSGINRLWSREFFGETEISDFEAYNATGRLDKGALFNLLQANSDKLDWAPWNSVLRKTPDGLPFRVACSGLYGFKARPDGDLTPLSAFMLGFKMLLNCDGKAMHGLDQGAFQVLVHFGLQAVNFPVQFLMISPFTGPIRHMVPWSEASGFPRVGGKLANCMGIVLAAIHQGDRNTPFWAPEVELTNIFLNERVSDEFMIQLGAQQARNKSPSSGEMPGEGDSKGRSRQSRKRPVQLQPDVPSPPSAAAAAAAAAISDNNNTRGK